VTKVKTGSSSEHANGVDLALRILRRKHGMTIGDLADKSGVSRSTISDLECARNQNPTAATLSKLAVVFGFTAQEMLAMGQRSESISAGGGANYSNVHVEPRVFAMNAPDLPYDAQSRLDVPKIEELMMAEPMLFVELQRLMDLSPLHRQIFVGTIQNWLSQLLQAPVGEAKDPLEDYGKK